MSFTVNHEPIPASHLWLCNGNGDVYILRDVLDCIEALKMSKMDSNLVQHEPNWMKVDSGFDFIQAGHSGLVCGIKNHNVYVRKGVSHDTPMGSGWSVAYCDALGITVGKSHVVYLSEDSTLYMTDIMSSLSEAVFLPNWTSIPQCDAENTRATISKFQHVLLDGSDRLFALTPAGEVFGYYSMLDLDDPSWKKVCGPPPIETNRSKIGQLVSWWKGDQTVLFSHVGVGKGCLWCVREKENGDEVWQLVLSELTKTDGKLDIKPNWVKFQLPLKDKIIHLCENKFVSGEMFVVCKNEMEETKIVFFALGNERSKGKVVIDLPKSCEYDSLDSFTICHTQTDVFTATPPPPKKQKVASLYPSIGAVEDYGLCCTTGDCYFCLKAKKEGSIINIRSVFMAPEHQSNTRVQESIPLASRAENSSSSSNTFHSNIQNRKRENPFSNTSESEESFGIHRSKKSKLKNSPEKSLLLDGIKVACVPPSPLDKEFEDPKDIELPSVLTAEQVNSQFVYSFEEEHIVLYDTATPIEQSL